MPTTPVPPTPPKPAAPVPAPPAIKKPSLNWATKNALNNGVETAQEWLKANDKALRGQAHARIDQAVKWVEDQAKPGVDKGLDWLVAKVNALKF